MWTGCVIVAAFAPVHGKDSQSCLELAGSRQMPNTGEKEERNSQASKWQRGI